jgi:predicted permease
MFGIGPALAATRAPVVSALKAEAGSVAGGGRQARVRRGLVVAQVALSMILLAGAGLFARTLFNLRSLDPGFAVDHLLTFSVDPSLNGYPQERVQHLMDRLRSELAGIAGVSSVSAAELGVLSGNDWRSTIRIEGYEPQEGTNMNPSFNRVGPAFFRTMGMPLVGGREFDERDMAGSPRVAVVNESMAKYFFGDGPAIGRRFGIGGGDPGSYQIVGVVRDAQAVSLRNEPLRFVYVPYRQADDVTALTFYVRTNAGAPSPAAAAREAVLRVDPALPVYDMKTMDAQVGESLFIDRMVALLSVAFGILATLLAAVGLYGVMSYSVARRTREIGIRMALGAERGRVLWLVVREGAMLAAIGVAVGLIGAAFLTRRVEAQLFGLSPLDPSTLAGAAALLAVVALLASYVPARRATSIDPMLALRSE